MFIEKELVIPIILEPVKVKGKIKEALDLHSKLMVPRAALMSRLALYLQYEDELAVADNSWLYLTKGIEQREVESGISVDETDFIFVVEKLKNVKPSDVIEASFYRTRNDPLEYCWMLEEFMEVANNPTEDYMIVNPSPSLIRKFEEYRNSAKGINHYVVMDRDIAFLYGTEFPKAKFWVVDQYDQITIQVSDMLIIGRDLDSAKTDTLMRWLYKCSGSALAYVANAFWDNTQYAARQLLRENGKQISTFLLLESGLSKLKPRKKSVVEIKPLENCEKSFFFGRCCSEDKGKVIRLNESTRVSIDRFTQMNGTVMDLWKQERQESKARRETYQKAVPYIFSDEIQLAYRWYENRGVAWYEQLEIHEGKKQRGKRVTPLIEKGLRCGSVAEMVDRLWFVAFHEEIYKYIYLDLQRFYFAEHIPVSLQTLWYYCVHLLENSKKYDREFFVQLFRKHPEVGQWIPERMTIKSSVIARIDSELAEDEEEYELEEKGYFGRRLNLANQKVISVDAIREMLNSRK